jgi:8-oxo-dGTP diphosphatase
MIDPADYLHVAAAVILNETGEILIARRPEHLHQGGLWEFPGGKVEKDESVTDALRRELEEELGIHVTGLRPLIRIPYRYPDRNVLLDVWQVRKFDGEPHGREGQTVRWVKPDELTGYSFPAANVPITLAARLPDRYLITPDPGARGNWPLFLQQLENALAAGLRLIQFRAKSLLDKEYTALGREISALCSSYGADLILNGKPGLVDSIGARGVHLTSQQLLGMERRPLAEEYWVAASCHGREELALAQHIGADFAVISPIKKTRSHPDARPIGWHGFHELTEASGMPVYALGGMTPDDLSEAWKQGGQGIAAISGLWKLSK